MEKNLSVNQEYSGTVKFYNSNKGFGFIYFDKEKQDIYFHITAINGPNPPKAGDKVSFSIQEKNGRKSACDIDVFAATVTPEINHTKTLQGFPCIRGDQINGFKKNATIKKITTTGYNTVDEAKEALISEAKACGANAVFDYIWHRESDLEDEYFLIWYQGKTRVTYFWAEGTAIRLIPI